MRNDQEKRSRSRTKRNKTSKGDEGCNVSARRPSTRRSRSSKAKDSARNTNKIDEQRYKIC